MALSLDISSIFFEAFGIDAEAKKTDTTRFNLNEAPQRTSTSSLGQQMYANDALGREFFLPVWIDGLLIPFAVVSVTEKKTIVSTAMPERGGSVKELISVDDYLFNIKGIVVANDNGWPEAAIIGLHEKFLKNESLVMRSALTDIFLKGPAEHKVAIKELKWPEVTGIENAKPFEMDVESDMIFNLELENITGPVNVGF